MDTEITLTLFDCIQIIAAVAVVGCCEVVVIALLAIIFIGNLRNA